MCSIRENMGLPQGAAFAAETAPANGRGWRRTFRLSRTCTSTATLQGGTIYGSGGRIGDYTYFY
eukprot:2829849-Prymnesium_polylepis.1